MSDLIAVTTWSTKRRHLAEDSFDRSKPVVISDLPPCKRCERAAAKRSVGADT